jgi:hypothetical protein
MQKKSKNYDKKALNLMASACTSGLILLFSQRFGQSARTNHASLAGFAPRPVVLKQPT